MDIAVKAQGITKSFVSQAKEAKTIKALDGVSLDIFSGEVLGILGPNGAGKTTFLNILSTLLLADNGTIEIFGEKVIPKNFYRIRQILNMSSGHPNFPWSLSVAENLRFYGRLYGLRAQALERKVDESIEMFGLGVFADQRFDELSSGTKQKLSLAKSILNDPKIIFLDEPTVGLDPDAAVKIREVIETLHKKLKTTIILTTHNMFEAEQMCRRIAFIKQGKILRLATLDELKVARGKKNLEEVFIDLAKEKIDPDQEIRPETVGIAQEKPSSLIHRDRQENMWVMAGDWLNRCAAFTYRNFIFSIRNFFAFVELVFWPIVSLVSIGLLGNYLQLGGQALGFIMTGAIAAGTLQVAQLDVAYSLLYEVWAKSVKHTFLTPVGVSEQLFGSWVIGVVRGILIFFILGVSAVLFFGFQFPPLPVVLVFLSGIFCFAFLLGLLVSFLILIFGQKAEITAWMFSYVFMLLCGIYYPIETLPKFFYYLAQCIPITYFLDYFRQSFGFSSHFEHGLFKGFVLMAVYFLFGLKMMQFAFHLARKKGVIVRLSE